jgi:deoxyribodipyrimidine photolyase
LVTAVFSDPISLVRDHRLKEMMAAEGIIVQSFNADLLYEPWEVVDDEGQSFTMFAPFWNRCLSMPYDPAAPLLPPKRINSGTWRIKFKWFSFYLFRKNVLVTGILGTGIVLASE